VKGLQIRWRRDINDVVRRLPRVVDATHATADAVAARARTVAPAFARHISAVDDVVVNDHPAGLAAEFGTAPRTTSRGANRGEMPMLAPLRHGAEQLGLDVTR
jgi:cephalosporin hydroxylase